MEAAPAVIAAERRPYADVGVSLPARPLPAELALARGGLHARFEAQLRILDRAEAALAFPLLDAGARERIDGLRRQARANVDLVRIVLRSCYAIADPGDAEGVAQCVDAAREDWLVARGYDAALSLDQLALPGRGGRARRGARLTASSAPTACPGTRCGWRGTRRS